jgi:hypothetical protein
MSLVPTLVMSSSLQSVSLRLCSSSFPDAHPGLPPLCKIPFPTGAYYYHMRTYAVWRHPAQACTSTGIYKGGGFPSTVGPGGRGRLVPSSGGGSAAGLESSGVKSTGCHWKSQYWPQAGWVVVVAATGNCEWVVTHWKLRDGAVTLQLNQLT